MSSAFYKKCVRDLKEDPWQRDSSAQAAHSANTAALDPEPLHARFSNDAPGDSRPLAGAAGCQRYPGTAYFGPIEYAAILEEAVDAAKRAGLKTILNIIYSISPKHTDEYFVQRTREAAKLDVARICFKDPGGLLTPESTRRLVPLILRETKGKPVEFHTHCTTGLGSICCWKRSSSASLRSIPRSRRWPTAHRIHRCSTWR